MKDVQDNLRGAALMSASMACFTVNDTFMKLVSDSLPLMQILFLRGLLTTFLLVIWARFAGVLWPTLSRRDWGLLGLRMVSEVGAAVCFLLALFNMPLANATAILQALPLTVTLAAALFLGEAVGWRRITAILLGFAGVLLILRPGPDGFNAYALLALGAVGFVTLRDLVTRRLGAAVPSLFVAVSTAAAVTAFGAVVGLGVDWRPITGQNVGLVIGASVFVLGGYLFSVMAMRLGDVGVVAPFRYTSLVWALCLGWTVFGDWPDSVTLVGALIVVGTGTFTLLRQASLRRSTRARPH